MIRLVRSPEGRLALAWRILAYLFLFLILLVLAEGALEALRRAGIHPLWRVTVHGVVAGGGTLALSRAWRRFVDRRPWSGMALPSPRRRMGDWAAGFGLGAAMAVLVFGIALAGGWIRIGGYGPATAIVVLAALVRNLVTGFVEELAMRGYVFQNTAERYPLWLATLANGVLFGILHLNQVDSALTGGLLIASAIAVSTLLILCRLITGSLWMAIGWHAAWNWVVGTLLGLGDGPALVRSERLAPAHLVGTERMPEVGLAFILVEVVGILLLLLAARRAGRVPDWRARLTPAGDLEGPRVRVESVTSCGG